MKPLNLQEFAEQLRLEGNQFADEILELITLEDDVVEPFSELCDELASVAPEALKEKPLKAAEWLGNRSEELDEIYALFPEEELKDSSLEDAIRTRIGSLEDITDILKGEGWDGEGDLVEALRHTLASWPPKLEYDL